MERAIDTRAAFLDKAGFDEHMQSLQQKREGLIRRER